MFPNAHLKWYLCFLLVGIIYSVLQRIYCVLLWECPLNEVQTNVSQFKHVTQQQLKLDVTYNELYSKFKGLMDDLD